MIAIYVRVSTQEQAVNGHSIDEQTDRLQKYCDAMNWSPCKVYCDAGYSGASTDRPSLQSMIRDVKSGLITRVLVYKLDRLSRSQKDTLYLIEDVFLANNCDFVSISENFDTSSPFGRAMIGILAVFAQLEREQIKERMIMGKVAKAKQGRYSGKAMNPIGYDYIDGRLIPNKYESDLVKRIFGMYSKGMSTRKIMETLNESGLYHKYGKWNEKTVLNIITRRTYIGEILYSGNWYKGDHEPIIDPALFDECQREHEKRYRDHEQHNRRLGKATSYLAGYLVCKHCGGKYAKLKQLSYNRDHTKKYYYNKYICNSRCKRVPHLIKDPNCMNKIWSMEELDKIIFDEIRKLAVDPEHHAPEKNAPQAHFDPLKAQLDNINGKMEKLMELYLIGNIPQDILQKKTDDLQKQREKLMQELDEITKSHEKRLSQKERKRLVESFSDILDRGDFDEIRTTIGALIDYIELDNDDITIHWNFD